MDPPKKVPPGPFSTVENGPPGPFSTVENGPEGAGGGGGGVHFTQGGSIFNG